ncbi:MAG: YbhB/YbcL family Raf kinase inhibitor-like protein [Candidatus Omnitrophota bacterium]
MKLTSPEFENNKYIPKRFGAGIDDVNPALSIENIPSAAKSLVLIVDDPDAPAGTWLHWIVYDIPVVSRIEEDSVPGKQGINTGGGQTYDGPWPPSGTHRYFFKIYALDKTLGLKEGSDLDMVNKAMDGHVLEKTELVGLYKR